MSSSYNMNINQDYYNNDYMRNTQQYQPQINNYSSEINFNINPFSSDNNNSKNFNINPFNNNYPQNYSSTQNRRNTISVFPFPRDSNLEDFNSQSGVNSIPPEQKIRKVTKIQPKIRKNFGFDFNNNRGKNNYNINGIKNKDISSENNMLKIKKSLMDEFSGTSSNNKNLNSKSENESLKSNKDFAKNNNLKKNIATNNNKESKNINSNINKNKKIVPNINQNIKNTNTKNNKSENNQKKRLSDNNLISSKINKNALNSQISNKVIFLQKLYQMCKNRLVLFEKRYINDIYFRKRDFFNNVFINNTEIGKSVPLTLIFYYLLNPKNEINHFSLQKSFFENVLLLHGYKNIKIKYDENELNQVPKFFNDLNYVNNLFDKFDEKKLNNLINEIPKWKNTFTCEISYEDTNTNNSINDQVKVYFVSPQDLIIEYNSCSSNLSKFFAEYNFHCDIYYNEEHDKFIFETVANVDNKCDELYQYEYLGEIWERALKVIIEEEQKSKLNIKKLFEQKSKKILDESKTDDNNSIKEPIDIKNEGNTNIDNSKNNNFVRTIKDKNLIKIDNNKIENKNFLKNNKNEIIEKNQNENKINNNSIKANEQILFYGVLVSLFLFLFKSVLSIELGTFSLETIFNFLIIFIIGFMLFKNQSSLKKN